MCQKLGKATTSVSETMLVLIQEIVGFQMFYQLVPDNPLKHFDHMGRQTDRVIVLWKCSAILLMNWGDGLSLISGWDVTLL